MPHVPEVPDILIIRECTYSPALTPLHLLPEALYLMAVTHFGLEDWQECGDLLQQYFETADPLDRNRSDAMLLRHWAETEARLNASGPPSLVILCQRALAGPEADRCYGASSAAAEVTTGLEDLVLPASGPKTLAAVMADVRVVDAALYDAWDENTFSNHTWVRTKVLTVLRGGRPLEDCEPESPNAACAAVASSMRENWEGMERLGFRRPPGLEGLLQRLVLAGGMGVTVRFRRSGSGTGQGA